MADVDTRSGQARWMDGTEHLRAEGQSFARRRAQKFIRLPRPHILSRAPISVRAALYTLHNDVYPVGTDGNNRPESKYLTLFRAMFRPLKSAEREASAVRAAARRAGEWGEGGGV